MIERTKPDGIWDCKTRFDCNFDVYDSSSYAAAKDDDRTVDRVKEKGAGSKVILNPFLTWKLSAYIRAVHTTEGQLEDAGRMPSDMTDPKAAWRKMLATQPPLAEVVVDHLRALHYHRVRASDLSKGVTIQDLVTSAAAFHGKLELDRHRNGTPEHLPLDKRPGDAAGEMITTIRHASVASETQDLY